MDSFFNCIPFIAKSCKSRGGNASVFASPETRVLYFAQMIIDVCLFSNKDISINESFGKAKEKMEQPKHNSQIA